MRLLLTLILIVLAPLQLAFAAGAEYCETGAAHAAHFGHHGHASQDGQDAPDAEPEDGSSPAKHCSFCHLGCSQLQASRFEVIALGVAPHYVAEETPFPVGIAPGVPYLPPRSALA